MYVWLKENVFILFAGVVIVNTLLLFNTRQGFSKLVSYHAHSMISHFIPSLFLLCISSSHTA